MRQLLSRLRKDYMRHMTEQDLDIYLKMLDKRSINPRAENTVRPNEDSEKQLRDLNTMAEYAIARYHEKYLPENEQELNLFSQWYQKRWISYKEYLRLTKLPF